MLFARQQAFLDAYGEESHWRIMHLRLHSGRRTESLAHYENFRAALGKELGLEPEDETRQLFECISSRARSVGANSTARRSVSDP